MMQVRSHNGERFRKARRIDLDQRPRTIHQFHSAILPINLDHRAAVELDLTAAEEVVVVAQIVAEVERVVELRSHTPMVHTRRTSSSHPPSSRLVLGIPMAPALQPGKLPRLRM